MKSKAISAPPKMFLYGYYGFGNVGDDLLLFSLVSALSKLSPKASFIVRSLNPVPNVVDARVQYVELEQILVRSGRSRWRRFVSYALALWRSLYGCSHLVFGGGTLFHARDGSSVNLVLITMMVSMARLRGAQVYALGVGVAALPAGLPRHLMRCIISLVKDFAVRDESSLAHCQCLSGGTQVRLTADLAFALPLERLSRTFSCRPALVVTLAASDIGQNGLGHEKFLASLATALQQLRNMGWKIRFVSFQELDCDGAKLSDSTLFFSLYRYGLREPVEIVRVSSIPTEIPRQFSDVEVVVGMRFHGHVLAALLGIPFVGLGRDSKLADLCGHFSMPFLAMSDLQSDGLVAAVEQVRALVPNRQKVSDLAQAALENFSTIGASIS